MEEIEYVLTSFHVDTKKEYNYAGHGLMVHEERTSR